MAVWLHWMQKSISITSVPKDKIPHPPDNPISDDEMLAFQEAMRDVTPLAAPNSVLPQPQQPEFIRNLANELPSIKAEWSDHIALSLAAGEEWSYLRPGLSRQILRKLRRGQWKVSAELDMHGMTKDQARQALATFLLKCKQFDIRCVCIIHGRGLSSKNNEPILKSRVGNWLAQCEDVLAFCQAPPTLGGSGAVIVLLKSQRSDQPNAITKTWD